MPRHHLLPASFALAVLLAGCGGSADATPRASGAALAPTATPAGSADPGASAPPSVAANPSAVAESAAPTDSLLALTLTDVRSGETFTLAELASEGPVLLEPMAVWCSNCRAQQHEVKRAHESAEFVSVSLDIDLTESPADLAAYADREGFGWRFAMADAALYRLLQERFGFGATNPPLTPLIVIDPDGTVRPLEFGRGTRSAEQLLAELGAG
jgi:thiol-disulfide isomerase/thioredoxin